MYSLFSNSLTLVYLADSDFNLVRIKVWGGLEVKTEHVIYDKKKTNYEMSYDNIVGDKNSLFNSDTNPTFLLPFLKIVCQNIF